MKIAKVIGATALVAVLGLTACNANPGLSGQGSSAPVTKGGTLNILTAATEINLDPAKSQNLAITTLGLIERRLTTWDISQDGPAKVVPDLATDTGTPSDGGKTWKFTLKDGLKYDDGSAVSTADIKYGLERSFAPELSGGLGYHKSLLVGGENYKGPYSGQKLASIETPDAKTIIFKLNKAYGDWPWIASMPAFAPVPAARDTEPQKYASKVAATGPYQLESYQQGATLKLKRNPHWSQETDNVRVGAAENVVFKLSQDATVAAQKLIADSGDDKNSFGAGFVPPAQLAQIQANPSAKARLTTSQAGALAYLAINTKRLKDLKLRQAIQYATDKKAYQTAVGGEIGGALATTLITPGIPGREDYDLYKADASGDLTKAKQLLQESGFDTNTNLTFVVGSAAEDLSKAQAIQQGLLRIGLKTTLKPLDDNALTEATTGAEGNYDLALGSWQPDFPSANANIQPLFASSEIGNGGYNISRYANPEVDKLIATATGETDQTKAGQLWAEIDQKIAQDSPVVPLVYTKNSFLHGSNVQNFFIGGFPAYPNYLKVSLKQ